MDEKIQKIERRIRELEEFHDIAVARLRKVVQLCAKKPPDFSSQDQREVILVALDGLDRLEGTSEIRKQLDYPGLWGVEGDPPPESREQQPFFMGSPGLPVPEAKMMDLMGKGIDRAIWMHDKGQSLKELADLFDRIDRSDGVKKGASVFGRLLRQWVKDEIWTRDGEKKGDGNPDTDEPTDEPIAGYKVVAVMVDDKAEMVPFPGSLDSFQRLEPGLYEWNPLKLRYERVYQPEP